MSFRLDLVAEEIVECFLQRDMATLIVETKFANSNPSWGTVEYRLRIADQANANLQILEGGNPRVEWSVGRMLGGGLTNWY